jgi:outer membrane immunogenic protein
MNMRNTTLLSIAAAGAMALPIAAQAADQAVPMRRTAPVVETFSWTGVYIGAYGGQTRFGSNDHLTGTPLLCDRAFAQTIDFGGSFNACDTHTANSSLGAILLAQSQAVPDGLNTKGQGTTWGGTIGYNHQFYRFVGGFELDFGSAGNATGSNIGSVLVAPVGVFNDDNPSCCSILGQAWQQEQMRSLGTLRARLGWLPWDPVLLYATGGLAFAKISSSSFLAQQWFATPVNSSTCCLLFTSTLQSADNWRAGVAFGGGIEVALGARFSIKGEYLYYNFGNWTYDMPQVTGTVLPPTDGNSARPLTAMALAATTRNFNGSRWIIGINYNFGAPAAAIDRDAYPR